MVQKYQLGSVADCHVARVVEHLNNGIHGLNSKNLSLVMPNNPWVIRTRLISPTLSWKTANEILEISSPHHIFFYLPMTHEEFVITSYMRPHLFDSAQLAVIDVYRQKYESDIYEMVYHTILFDN